MSNCRFPRQRNFLFTFGIFFTYLMTAVTIYWHKLDGVLMVKPEYVLNRYTCFWDILIYFIGLYISFSITFRALKYGLWFDESYLKFHIPTNTNAGSYMFGITFGYIYKKVKQQDVDLKKYKVIYYDMKEHKYSFFLRKRTMPCIEYEKFLDLIQNKCFLSVCQAFVLSGSSYWISCSFFGANILWQWLWETCNLDSLVWYIFQEFMGNSWRNSFTRICKRIWM